MRNVHLVLNMKSIGKVESHILVDKERAEKQSIGLLADKSFCAITDQVQICFEKMMIDKNVVAESAALTMQDLIRRLPVGEPAKNNKFKFDFKNGIMCFDNIDWPVKGIEFVYDAYQLTDHIDIYGDDVIKAIVKNITEGTETQMDKFGRASSRESL